MPRWLAAFAIVVAAGGAAMADGIRIEHGGGACALDGLESSVAALVGDDLVDDVAARVIHVAAVQADELIRAVITIGDEPSRVLEARDCGELVEAVAVVIAVALRAPLAVAEPELAPAPAAEPAPAPLRVTASIAIPSRRTTPPVELALLAGGGAVWSQAGWTPEVTVGARVVRGRAALGLELALRPSEDLPIGDAGRIVVTTTQVALVPCVRARIDVCAVLTGGVIRGRGEELVDARSATTPVLAAGGRVVWERPVSRRLALQLHGEVRAALTSSRFRVDGMPVWTSAPAEATAGASLVAHIP